MGLQMRETKEARQVRIERQMKARREKERLVAVDQGKPGWSEGMTWQELLNARAYPNINVRNL